MNSVRNNKVVKTKTFITCNYCNNKSKDVWVNKKNTIMCCRYCWGNHPIVARATLGLPFPLDSVKPLEWP